MPPRTVTNGELAQIAKKYGAAPVADDPRSFDIPNDKLDAFKADVERLKGGATIASVLAPPPAAPTRERDVVDRIVDVGRGALGATTSAVLNPLLAATQLLTPKGQGVQAALAREGQGRTLTNNEVYNALTAVPQTASGRIGAALPLVAGAVTGVSEVGAIPTAASLAAGYAGQKAGGAGAEWVAKQAGASPEDVQAARALGETGGMLIGGVAGGKLVPRNAQEAMALAERVKPELQRRAVSAAMGAAEGAYFGPKGMAAGATLGAIAPDVQFSLGRGIRKGIVSAARNSLKDILTEAAQPAESGVVTQAVPKVTATTIANDVTLPVEQRIAAQTFADAEAGYSTTHADRAFELKRLASQYHNAPIASTSNSEFMQAFQKAVNDFFGNKKFSFATHDDIPTDAQINGIIWASKKLSKKMKKLITGEEAGE